MPAELTNVLSIRAELRRALAPLGDINRCVLLEYRRNVNVGIHLLWLGTAWFVQRVLKAETPYVASATEFSAEAMRARAPEAPIVVRGGVLGDVWDRRGDRRLCFFQEVVAAHHGRRIVFLPQGIHFNDPANLAATAAVFNAHPELTLYARDEVSYELARRHFGGCQVLLAPDIAFWLADCPEFRPAAPPVTGRTLYLRRTDHEGGGIEPEALGLPEMVTQDWVTCDEDRAAQGAAAQLAKLGRELLDRLRPPSLLARLGLGAAPDYHRYSVRIAMRGARQLRRYRHVVTNRLHGHLLCSFLGIPHVVLPGPHPLIEALYRTWTCKLPFGRFARTADEVPAALASVGGGDAG